MINKISLKPGALGFIAILAVLLVACGGAAAPAAAPQIQKATPTPPAASSTSQAPQIQGLPQRHLLHLHQLQLLPPLPLQPE